MRTVKLILACVFLALLLVMGYATFLEQAHGTAYAAEHVYDTSWFFALWAVLALASVIVMGAKQLYRRAAVCCLHVSLLLILCGAAVTWFTADDGLLHVREGASERQYLSDDRLKELPFTVRLDSFRIDYYPGSQAPADFISYVRVTSSEAADTAVAVSMNRILHQDGYRLYQSSFDPDHKGTILSVRYDPWGTPLTYFGYALLGLSMVWVLLARKEEFRQLLRRLASYRTASVLLLLLLPLLSQARSVPTIPADKAERMARMQVVYNDRVAPFSTLAHDFTQKIYGRSSYCGLSAEQVVYGWMARPEDWKEEPMIKVKDGDLRRQLGIEGTYATLAQLFDAKGNYRLLTLNGPSGQQSAPSKAVRELDEKVGLIVMLTSGELVKPLPKGVTPLSEQQVSAEILYNTIPFSKILFMFCLTVGFLSFFLMLYESGSHRRVPYVHGVLTLLLWAAFLFHLFGYLLRWYVSGRVPLGNGYETMIFMALTLMVITLLLHRRFSFVLPFGFLLSGFTLLVSYLGQMNPQITHLMPVLSSPLLSSHVSIIMMSYALLAFMMLNGLYALLLSWFSKSADLEVLTLLNRLMLYPAVFFLAAGIFLGALWANVSWGRYWGWDPKEVWALITFMIYAVPFHQQSLPWLRRPRVFHAYLVLAFLAVLMTFFGVNYFLGGMHSYA